MAKGLEPQILTEAFMAAMGQMLEKLTGISPSEEPKVEESEIAEYDDRMRASGVEKFNSTTYISVVNFYLNQTDMERRKTKGAMVLYFENENMSKFLKAFGIKFPEDEDSQSMMDAGGEVAVAVADAFKAELARKGFADLVASKPSNYRNNVIEGVEFSIDQKTKQTVSYFYFRTKVIAADLTMAELPRK